MSKTYKRMSAAAKKRGSGVPYITPAQEREMVRLRKEGWFLSRIAAQFLVSASFVQKRLAALANE